MFIVLDKVTGCLSLQVIIVSNMAFSVFGDDYSILHDFSAYSEPCLFLVSSIRFGLLQVDIFHFFWNKMAEQFVEFIQCNFKIELYAYKKEKAMCLSNYIAAIYFPIFHLIIGKYYIQKHNWKNGTMVRIQITKRHPIHGKLYFYCYIKY